MAKIKKETVKPGKVTKVSKEVKPRPKIDDETRDNLKKMFEQTKPVNIDVVYVPERNIDTYLTENGISFVYEGQKLCLTAEKIKSLILNWK